MNITAEVNELVAEVFNWHCATSHNADFEVCGNRICRAAVKLEAKLGGCAFWNGKADIVVAREAEAHGCFFVPEPCPTALTWEEQNDRGPLKTEVFDRLAAAVAKAKEEAE